jgi:hypothetical protein
MTANVRVELPCSLRILANTPSEVTLTLPAPPTQHALIDALEAAFPALRGTLRDPATHRRRPFIRFFAAQQDLSHRPPDEPLPQSVAEGRDVFMVVGAIAGG